MLKKNNQKSIREQIFDEMFIVLEKNNEFTETSIKNLKDIVEKNFFKNQKDIENALKE